MCASTPSGPSKHLKQALNHLQALLVLACYTVSVLHRHCQAHNVPTTTHYYHHHHLQQVSNAPLYPTQFGLADPRRPIWNMAHMVNSIKELDHRLGKGANAIETDIKFSKDGHPLYTYHGTPCDCWRHCHQQEELPVFLRYARDLTSDDEPAELGQNFTLLLLDLKLSSLKPRAKEVAGAELARTLVDNLFASSIEVESNSSTGAPPRRGTHLKVVLSVNHVDDAELVNHFIHQLGTLNSSHLLADRIGFDVGMNDDLDQIESMWRRFRLPLNLWQGDGYTNCISPFYGAKRLSEALVRRDSAQGYPRKVYQWSVDLHDRLRESLMLGVDAIITNHPERLASILAEPAIADNFRLATRHDDPFRKLYFRPSYRTPGGANSLSDIRYQRSVNLVGGGLVSALADTFSSCFSYLWEIPSFSLPATSRLLTGNAKRHKQSSLYLAKSDTEPTSGAQNSSSSSPSGTTATEAPVTTSTTTDSPNSTVTSTTPSEEARSATTLNDTAATDTQPRGPTFDGPRWYTSLASNLLVSALKLAMPEES